MDHTENSLRAVVTSLRGIVGPAVDPGDPLAQQQLGLSIMYLEFLASRLPHLPERDRFEALSGADLADAVVAAAGRDVPGAGELSATADRARSTTERPGATREELRAAAAVVAARVSELLESDLDDAVRPAVEQAVVEHSVARVEFDRSWYAPMGFDPDPGSVTPWSEQLPP